jgi:hypothetical protein
MVVNRIITKNKLTLPSIINFTGKLFESLESNIIPLDIKTIAVTPVIKAIVMNNLLTELPDEFG